ncbi:M3 family metallopeptidase [Echinimonas agarilytica]|uniref:M3 family metallopeptidase n=1 Tax=Echinimonas agarilytica TaxID=1215918 RepID=A0AA41W667_9GAMM|nr:M3 family metallopeptidase [Echinimonas agarilytica]MCM2679755.1 M3 family metallopeptidase [Echinimonas agarilytica]
MRLKISQIKLISFFCALLLSGVGHAIATEQSVWPNTVSELNQQCDTADAAFDPPIKFDEADERVLFELDSRLQQVHEQLKRVMVIADASSNSALRDAAVQCIDRLSYRENHWFQKDSVVTALTDLEDEPLSKQGQRVMSLWRYQGALNATQRAAHASDLLAVTESAYIDNIKKIKKRLRMPERCLQGVQPERVLKWQFEGQFELPLSGKDVSIFLASDAAVECRKMAWTAYHSRGLPENIIPFDAMMSQRRLLASMLGFDNWASWRLRTSMLNSTELVNDFLTTMHSKHAPKQPLDPDWLWTLERRSNSSAQYIEMTPTEVITQSFEQLEKYGLTASRVSRGTLWHPSVQVYQISANDQPLGLLMLDVYSRKGKFSKPRMRGLKRAVYEQQHAETAVIVSLPRREWDAGHALVYYQQLGLALQHIIARADYHTLSGGPIEPDVRRLGAHLGTLIAFENSGPKHAEQQQIWRKQLIEESHLTDTNRFAKQLFNASKSLSYHTIEANSPADYTDINAPLFRAWMSVPMPTGLAPQYSSAFLAHEEVLYFARIWSEQLALFVWRCDKKVSSTQLLQQLFRPAGQNDMIENIADTCRNIKSKADLVQTVATQARQ